MRSRTLVVDHPAVPQRAAFRSGLREWALRHPVGLGSLVAGLLLAALVLAQWVLGRYPFSPEGSPKDVRVAVFHCIATGYMVAAYFGVIRSARHRVVALRPRLDTDDSAFEETLRSVDRFPVRVLLGWGAVGLVGSFLGPYLTEPDRAGPLAWWDPTAWSPEVAWHRTLGPVLAWWMSWFGCAVVLVSRRLSELAKGLRPVDLFDLEPLRPFTQQGLTNALLAVGILSLYGMLLVDFGVTLMHLTAAAFVLGVVCVALVLPVRGVHLRIREAKRAELAWCRAALREERRAVRAEERGTAGGRLADLSAYEAQVERVQEWPFDTSTLARVTLYLFIPLGSWVASALVQHVVERAILRP